MLKLCAFDLDGTLVNTIGDMAAALNGALHALALPELSEAEVQARVGNGMRKLCERALPAGREDLLEELQKRYNERYVRDCCERSRVYAGIPALLASLRAQGAACAVVTNKPQPQTDRVITHFFPADSFCAVLGQSDRYPRKPAPDMLRAVMAQCGARPQEVVYVGDSDVDVRLAQNAGVPCVGAAWGFRGRDFLAAAGAQRIADAPGDLLPLLLAAAQPD